MSSLTTGKPRRTLTSRGIRTAVAVFTAAGMACASVAVGAAAAAPRATHSSAKPIVVWVDAARLTMVKAYEKANPGIKIDTVTFDGGANGSGSIESKVALFNRVGHGWPDIVFSTEQNDVQTLGAAPFNFPATLNNGLVPTSVLKNYATGALSPCQIGTKLECLRNDLAFDVLWVDVPLMKQWGYTVPTTWQQWQAIGESVAKKHPGYIIGTLGNSYDDAVYLQAAQCHMNDLINSYTVLDNPADPNCVKMANLLNPLLKDGSVPPVNVFGATFGKKFAGKVLMMVGPAWYGGAIFNSTSGLNSPKGTIEAAAPLTWAGSSQTWTGDVGGGLWIMSSHTTQPKLVAQVLVGLATSSASQDVSSGYPGYVPAAGAWITEQDASGYYVSPLAPVFAKAATEIWTGWSQTRWDVFGLWAANVTPNLIAGDTVSSQLPVMGSVISNYAQSDGFQVTNK